MSKHIGLFTKVDNTGAKWYRKVVNVGSTNISAHQIVKWKVISITGNSALSGDYNLVELNSGDAYGLGNDSTDGCNEASVIIAGVAIENIPKYSVGTTVSDGKVNPQAIPGSGSGWVQFKGACQLCAVDDTTAGLFVAPNCATSETSYVGSGAGMGNLVATAWPDGIHGSAGSGVIGYWLESTTYTAGGNLAWAFLTL